MTFSHIVWAEQVAAGADLPDRRLESRLTAILVDTSERPSASITQAAGDDGQAKATYRFYANERTATEALHRGVALEAAQRSLDQDVLLIVQDTTTLNFTALQHTIPELGPIDSGGLARGVHLHTALAVSDSGQVIGILDQQYWARPQPGQPGPEEKESGKWIHGIDAARAALYEAAGDRAVPRRIHVMDREGDAYEVMMAVEDAGDSAIIRCAQNRRVDDPLATAHQAVRRPAGPLPGAPRGGPQGGCPPADGVGGSAIDGRDLGAGPRQVPARLADDLEPGGGLGSRAATRGPAGALAALDARAGGDRRRGPGGGAEIHPALADRGDALDAQERLQSGGPSLGDLGRPGEGGDGQGGGGGADRVVARPGAGDAEAPALGVLEADEVEVLVRHFGKGKPIAAGELTIRQAVLWIGRLGGHLNRKGDGMPGVRTLWRGLHDLTLLVAGFRAAKRIRE